MEFQRSLRLLFERGFAIVAMIVLMGAFQGKAGFVENTLEQAAEGSRTFRMIVGLIYLISIFLVLKRSALLFSLLRQNLPIVLLAALAVISTIWSVEPMLTLRRAIALCGGTAFAFFLVMYFPPERLLRLIAWSLGIVAVCSLGAALLMPDYGIQSGPRAGDWRGVMGHKSTLGRTMVLGALAFLLLAMRRRASLSSLMTWAALGLCLFLLVMSQSRTAWLVGLILLLLFPAAQLVQRTHWTVTSVAVFTAMVVGIVGAQIASDQLFQLLGRDATLTGRTVVWSTAMEFGIQRPILGYGYKVFWLSEPGAELAEMLNNFVGNGHNGFLDLWLELGLVGLALFLVSVYMALKRVMHRLVTGGDPLALWYVGYVTAFLVMNTSSSSILMQNDLDWILYIVVFYHAGLPPGAFYAHARRARRRLGAPILGQGDAAEVYRGT